MLHSLDDYRESVRKLFPQGVYWDKQFEATDSDLSLWVDLKATEIYNFRFRFPGLVQESTPKTADKTIDSWERIILGDSANPNLPIEDRRRLLLAKQRGGINIEVLRDIATIFGATIYSATLPYRSAFVGHTRIGINRMCSPASFSLLFINVSLTDTTLRPEFESAVRNVCLAGSIIKFFITVEITSERGESG